jgi:hypothetical protein
MYLKSLPLNFEQLENKIALSALPNSGYRDLGRKARPTQQIVRQAKKPPLYVQNVPFNAIKSAAIESKSKPVIQNQPLINTTTIVPIKFVQNIMPDGSIRCQQVNNVLNTVLNQNSKQSTNENNATQTNNVVDKNHFPLFVMSVTPSGAIHCVATPGKVLQRGA